MTVVDNKYFSYDVVKQMEFQNKTASNIKPLDPEEFRRLGHTVVDFLADYYKNIEKYPVLSQVQPGYLQKCLPSSAPYNPEPFENILADIDKHIVPGLTHWQSPNFFAYFQANGSIAGVLGELLTSGFNVVGFNWMASPAATELESIVMDWLGKMLHLPKPFLFAGDGGGVIHGTTCEAILCTMVAARDQMLNRIGRKYITKLAVYGSDQTHSGFVKAAKIAGIEPTNIQVIKTTKDSFFELSPNLLRKRIAKDIDFGLVPLFLCATVGTTSTAAVDPVGALCDVAKDYNIWVHVDAAYAGSACICPEFRHFIDGIEGANSFSMNAHKWLLSTLDCCCLWVKDPSALIKSLSTYPEFLTNKISDLNQVVDYKDWQLTLSRRFRAMKLWLVLRTYGVVNLQNYLRKHVKMAKLFEGFIATDKRLEIVVPRSFAMVCFRISPAALRVQNVEVKGLEHIGDEEHANMINRKLLESINASGQIFMTHGVVSGIYIIRFAVGATLTEEEHVINAWKVIQEHANTILPIA